MSALTTDRDTPTRDGELFEFPVAADTTIYAGALVCLNATGFAVPGDEDDDYTAVGRAEQRVVNGAVAGAVRVRVRRGVFRYANSAEADAITLADVGATCYVVDDQTVAKTDDTGSRPPAGKVLDVDSAGVWVLIG